MKQQLPWYRCPYCDIFFHEPADMGHIILWRTD